MVKFIIAILAVSLFIAPVVQAAEVVKVAVAGPFTGNAAAFGDMIRKGAELKAKELNAKGGIKGKKLELVFGDDVADPREANLVATKFASDKSILAVVGHFNSSCSLAGKPIYKRYGVVELSPGSTNVNVCIGSPWTFRNVYRDDFQGQFLAKYVKNVLKFQKVAVFYDNDDYGSGLKDAFINEARKIGLNIIAVEAYDRKTTDFTAQLTNFKTKNPDAIFISGLYNEAGLIVSQARRLGISAQFLGADGVDSPGFLQIAGKAAEGTLLTTPFLFDKGSSEAAKVYEAFKKGYKVEPDCWAALTYDAVGMIAEAIEKAGENRKAIRDYLAAKTSKDKGYKGITGLTYFDENGDCYKPAYVKVVKNGKFTSAGKQMLE